MKKPARKIAWHHFKFRVPSDWEVTAYSLEDRVGRLEFSTREGFQAVVSWEPCKREPDSRTMMIAFLQRNAPGAEQGTSATVRDLDTVHIGRFFVGYHSEDGPCQAMYYLKDAKKLIRWVFRSSEKRLREKTCAPVLESFEPNGGAEREYAIFGLDFVLPEEFKLEDMNALPANVMMAFESGSRARAIFRRWGMPEVVLGGKSLVGFYPAFLKVQGCVVNDSEETEVAGMKAAKVRYRERGQHHMDKFMGRYWDNGEALLWHNEGEKRLYAFEQISPRKAPLLVLEEVFPLLNNKGSGDK
jgi:hypothetical protein